MIFSNDNDLCASVLGMKRLAEEYDRPGTIISCSPEAQYASNSLWRPISLTFRSFFANGRWLLFIWISTHTWDLGEISLYTHMPRWVYVVKRPRTYGRWTGAHVWLSFLSNSIVSPPTINTSLYFKSGTSCTMISFWYPRWAIWTYCCCQKGWHSPVTQLPKKKVSQTWIPLTQSGYTQNEWYNYDVQKFSYRLMYFWVK